MPSTFDRESVCESEAWESQNGCYIYPYIIADKREFPCIQFSVKLSKTHANTISMYQQHVFKYTITNYRQDLLKNMIHYIQQIHYSDSQFHTPPPHLGKER